MQVEDPSVLIQPGVVAIETGVVRRVPPRRFDAIAKGELHSLIHRQTENQLEKPVAGRGFEIRHD